MVWRAGIVAAVALLAACGGGNVSGGVAESGVPLSSAQRRALAQAAILFGHQSVGGDIVRGLGELPLERADDPLRVVAWTPGEERPGLMHFFVGRNGDPRGKTSDFARAVASRPPGTFDVALHKYCFADFDDRTDPRALFESYRAEMSRLRRERPNTVFVHVTTPLTAPRLSLKDRVKLLLGRDVVPYEQVAAIHRFNEAMRAEYRGREPLFDLAALEAAGPDGRVRTIVVAGAAVPTLWPAYTDDGGHLNATGRARVSAAFAAYLAQLAEGRR